MNIEETVEEGSERKRRAIANCREYLMPARVDTLKNLGIPLLIGRREGYRIWDVDGHELLDLHLNGGTYNLGHRNPDLMETLRDALDRLDIGNHHFPSEARGELAAQLAALTPGDLHYSVLTPSGSEANDVAVRAARRATGRRKIVALEAAYHGRAGLGAAAGEDEAARYFLSDYPDEFIKVPFDDLEAMDAALSGEDVAAVLMETIPATYGFPVPSDGYLPGVKSLCERYGSLYIADEVQTGLGRTGFMWGIEAWGVQPDILVTGKGLSGGLYPIAAVVMTKSVGAWLGEAGWVYASTFGGAELGCVVASRVLEICSDPEVLAGGRETAGYLASGLEDIRARRPFLKAVRQKGLVMGLELDGPGAALQLSGILYRHGIWAIFAGFDPSVLQFKPGLLVDRSYCDILLERLDAGLAEAGA